MAQRLGTSSHQLYDHLKAKVGQELTQDIVSTSASSSVWYGDFVWEIEPDAQATHWAGGFRHWRRCEAPTQWRAFH